MTKIILLTSIALMLFGCNTTKQLKDNNSLKMFPRIIKNHGKYHLYLALTNTSKNKVTVLTKGFSHGHMISNGTTIPNIGFGFIMMTIGTTENPEEWKYVPSLPELAPVTLFQGETACLNMELNPVFNDCFKDPETIFTINYSIGKKMAKRFDLWRGSIFIEKPVKSLLEEELDLTQNLQSTIK